MKLPPRIKYFISNLCELVSGYIYVLLVMNEIPKSNFPINYGLLYR